MKKVLLPILIAFGIIFISSCEGVADVDILNLNNNSDDLIENEWTIGYYLNNNVVETSEFSNYKLRFKRDNTIEANKPFNQVVGKWVEDKVSKYISINFDNTNASFNKLSETWIISFKDDKSYQFIKGDNTEVLKIEHQ